ncbi:MULTISPECIES: HrgA protein [unclassified Campylobacter]|uniref:HrgA protein n=1 Tax=unclassified Campylobacter TaxID=2593542 RepID=UPI0022E9AF15|nr:MULTISPECIES: HrgA protein [unclassified Campylobacter]MDA3055586.1 HrgA protein [Campylobacter sp. CN_NA1]MDA3064724.1 HrgA protein [Campylobacter sp. CN_NE4]MDA3068452.1 HrgA protein [Campylobacter sp. CN_NE3]MDA3082235.1 HrgA protein [Campylobacter sp. CN_EL2]MDA3083870.1 HrgA protein [Campylobacter sp. CN_NE1]
MAIKVKSNNSNLMIAKEILEKAKEPLNPNRMYGYAIDFGLDDKLTYKGKTPLASFARDIYMDVKENENTMFEIVQTKPKLLIKLKTQNFKEDIQFDIKPNQTNEPKTAFNERDLHPFLVNFIFSNENFRANAKTIFHEESRKSQKGMDKWLYPDIVGVNFEYGEFSGEVGKFISKFDILPIKIFSFEMKKELSVGNFREYYFQAVSNSSWANEGYLVACNIDENDEELLGLIKRSNQSFGIGVINLNLNEPAQSVILAQAEFKEKLDYTVINELANKNPNFKKFLETIHDYDPKNGARFKNEFDKILKDEELENYKKEKKIK